MRAYSQLIEDNLVGETPKEKYDYLIWLQKIGRGRVGKECVP